MGTPVGRVNLDIRGVIAMSIVDKAVRWEMEICTMAEMTAVMET